MKVLLLSAYDAASHRQWYQTLQEAFSADDWTVLRLPARYFSWRVRGNSLSWAFSHREVLEAGYDVVLATSMVDLSALRGFVPKLAAIPTVLYFHENQFAYPATAKQFSSVEPQLLSIYSALAADRLAFNSDYNRRSFLAGAEQLLAKFPDHVPKGLPALLADKSQLLPVPLNERSFASPDHTTAGPLQLLWNHRWEYDKAPERLLHALKIVLEQGVELHLSIVGEQFRHRPKAFDEMEGYLRDNFPQAIKQWGYVADSQAYQQLLVEADVVVSTAIHDFQGLAVMEAVAAGAIPIVPDRLCYPQWFDSAYRYGAEGLSDAQEAAALASRISQLAALKQRGELPSAPDVSACSIAALQAEYQRLLSF